MSAQHTSSDIAGASPDGLALHVAVWPDRPASRATVDETTAATVEANVWKAHDGWKIFAQLLNHLPTPPPVLLRHPGPTASEKLPEVDLLVPARFSVALAQVLPGFLQKHPAAIRLRARSHRKHQLTIVLPKTGATLLVDLWSVFDQFPVAKGGKRFARRLSHAEAIRLSPNSLMNSDAFEGTVRLAPAIEAALFCCHLIARNRLWGSANTRFRREELALRLKAIPTESSVLPDTDEWISALRSDTPSAAARLANRWADRLSPQRVLEKPNCTAQTAAWLLRRPTVISLCGADGTGKTTVLSHLRSRTTSYALTPRTMRLKDLYRRNVIYRCLSSFLRHRRKLSREALDEQYARFLSLFTTTRLVTRVFRSSALACLGFRCRPLLTDRCLTDVSTTDRKTDRIQGVASGTTLSQWQAAVPLVLLVCTPEHLRQRKQEMTGLQAERYANLLVRTTTENRVFDLSVASADLGPLQTQELLRHLIAEIAPQLRRRSRLFERSAAASTSAVEESATARLPLSLPEGVL